MHYAVNKGGVMLEVRVSVGEVFNYLVGDAVEERSLLLEKFPVSQGASYDAPENITASFVGR